MAEQNGTGRSEDGRRRARRRGVAMLAAAALAWGGAAHAEETAAEAAPSPGRDAYLQYCAACHGPDARGHGPMAGELRTAPPDLTRLAERFGTPLRAQQILERVDGRNMARAHGSRDMPVWGRKLAAPVPRTQSTEVQTRGTLLLIIQYLNTIQQPG